MLHLDHRLALITVALSSLATPTSAAIRQVGSGKTYARPCQAFAAASDGDVIEIDAGTYSGDVCRIARSGLTIRGVGGRARIDAAGANAEGKGTWVIGGNDTTIEDVEMFGAAVADQNGAAIRQEGANLTLRRCYLHHNENGVLCGANAASEILIEYSELAYNGYGDGYTHNLYIGHIARFTLRFSYSHHAKVGHNVKSRATRNYILYNRISDEADGTASYSIDLPNGGTSYIIGNLVQQGPLTQNSAIISYAAEGASNAGTELFVVNNSLVNDRGSGTFVQVGAGASPVVLRNNVFFGGGSVTAQAGALNEGNVTADPLFVAIDAYDYRLTAESPCVGVGVDPGTGAGESLAPTSQYVHPSSGEARPNDGDLDVGAYEIGDASGPGDDGGAPDGGDTGDDADGGNADGGDDAGAGDAGSGDTDASDTDGSDSDGSRDGDEGADADTDEGADVADDELAPIEMISGCSCGPRYGGGVGFAALVLLLGLFGWGRRRSG